jgi:hypothetical protein
MHWLAFQIDWIEARIRTQRLKSQLFPCYRCPPISGVSKKDRKLGNALFRECNHYFDHMLANSFKIQKAKYVGTLRTFCFVAPLSFHNAVK